MCFTYVSALIMNRASQWRETLRVACGESSLAAWPHLENTPLEY